MRRGDFPATSSSRARNRLSRRTADPRIRSGGVRARVGVGFARFIRTPSTGTAAPTTAPSLIPGPMRNAHVKPGFSCPQGASSRSRPMRDTYARRVRFRYGSASRTAESPPRKRSVVLTARFPAPRSPCAVSASRKTATTKEASLRRKRSLARERITRSGLSTKEGPERRRVRASPSSLPSHPSFLLTPAIFANSPSLLALAGPYFSTRRRKGSSLKSGAKNPASPANFSNPETLGARNHVSFFPYLRAASEGRSNSAPVRKEDRAERGSVSLLSTLRKVTPFRLRERNQGHPSGSAVIQRAGTPPISRRRKQ